MFVAAGLALALVTLWLRRDLRGNMINMSVTMGVGLVGLDRPRALSAARSPTRRSCSSSAKCCCCSSPSASLGSSLMFAVPGRARTARDPADPGRRADRRRADRVRALPDEGRRREPRGHHHDVGGHHRRASPSRCRRRSATCGAASRCSSTTRVGSATGSGWRAYRGRWSGSAGAIRRSRPTTARPSSSPTAS